MKKEQVIRKSIQDISNWTIMKHVEAIVEIMMGSKLSEASMIQCSPHAKDLGSRLNLTETQAILLSIFIDQSCEESIRMADLAQFFGCRNIALLCYGTDIDHLVERGYLRRKKATLYQKFSSYRVPEDVVNALRTNTVYTAPSVENLSIHDFMSHLYQLFKAVEDAEMTLAELSSNIEMLINNNIQLPICKAIRNYQLYDKANYALSLAMFFCHRLINENDDCIGYYDLEQLFDSKVDYNRVRNALKNREHSVMRNGVIEIKKDGTLSTGDYFCLTDQAKDELLSELNLELKTPKCSKTIIAHTDITPKQLFYNHEEQEQIQRLNNLLEAKNYESVQKRLAQSGLRTGFACLFYGSPGTGKTETVYQLARKTGRDIFTVNVSDIKSMWVGESEKNIKSLFDHYRILLRNSTIAPILLFNEADALLGIRQAGAERAAEKMENSIQNIILQEMEFLDGIMVATTNLTQNLDAAFERRFLYKIEFNKPSVEAKMAIWQSMIPNLSSNAANELACRYDFSGGEIENIARKRMVEMIIVGKEPSLEMIHAYCQNEKLQNTFKRTKIGY